MKSFIFLFCFIFLFNTTLKAQEKKDTLFFSFDKNYTILSDNSSLTYPDWIERTNEQMIQTKTNGYVSFGSTNSSVKNLKPKKILSIKEHIENRKFYFDGKYNKIIDNIKLKRFLTDKYVIFFVKENAYLEVKDLDYISYYPRRDKNWDIIQNPIKDTLFFKLDKEYVYQNELFPGEYFIKENGTDGSFFLKEVKKEENLKQKNSLNLKEFIQSSLMYNKHNKVFNTNDLCQYLSNYIIFLLAKNDNEIQYIEVRAGYAIE